MAWVLYSHRAGGYVVGDGTYAATCQGARAFKGAAALSMCQASPGDVEAIRVYLDDLVNH